MDCPHCNSSDVIGPFVMDGYRQGEYRTDWSWIVCRDCNRSSSVEREGVPA